MKRCARGRGRPRRDRLRHSSCTMMAVPRRPRRAADEAAETPDDGAAAPPAGKPASSPEAPVDPVVAPPDVHPVANGVGDHAETALVPVKPTDGPHVDIDPGLYAVLKLDPSSSDSQ